MNFPSKTAVFTLAALALACEAVAAPTVVSKHKDWSVYKDTIGGETICYAATPANDMSPKSVSHGDVWFYVTSWKSGRAKNQPSLKVGYELRSDLPGKINIGRSSWSLYGAGREGFADDADDAKIVNAVKAGSDIRIEAVSSQNTKVAYYFSLSGSTNAINDAASACR